MLSSGPRATRRRRSESAWPSRGAGGTSDSTRRCSGAFKGALSSRWLGTRSRTGSSPSPSVKPRASRGWGASPSTSRARGRLVAFIGTDDGRGVDLEAVRGVAQKRGLPSNEVSALGAEELLGLLLKGGLTTAASVTEVSGRGVGLDVVRETAERLGGEVVVRTKRGEGTTVELVVPVSVASVLGLVVDAGGVIATIPLEAVVRTLRLDAADIARTAEGETVVPEGGAVPFLPLTRALSLRQASPRGRPPPGRPWSFGDGAVSP